ncbi:MAG: hypothetical protein Q7T80_11350 [Methanoregula sp.]|nr:hypothetical protein [Methanoregula sp.]
MEKGDIITLVVGLFIVLVIAVLANPQYLSSLKGIGEKATPAPTSTPFPASTVVNTAPVTQAVIKPTPIPVITDAPPYQIVYSDKPFTYPVFKLPENMETYGASDIVARNKEMVPFAYVDGTRGGITRTFSVPYPIWIINTTVTANTTPQYGRFRMALCYAKDGSIIEGEEILNRGNSYRVVQISNTDMYMIISTAYIDEYHISLEAPRNYYDLYRPQ